MASTCLFVLSVLFIEASAITTCTSVEVAGAEGDISGTYTFDGSSDFVRAAGSTSYILGKYIDDEWRLGEGITLYYALDNYPHYYTYDSNGHPVDVVEAWQIVASADNEGEASSTFSITCAEDTTPSPTLTPTPSPTPSTTSPPTPGTEPDTPAPQTPITSPPEDTTPSPTLTPAPSRTTSTTSPPTPGTEPDTPAPQTSMTSPPEDTTPSPTLTPAPSRTTSTTSPPTPGTEPDTPAPQTPMTSPPGVPSSTNVPVGTTSPVSEEGIACTIDTPCPDDKCCNPDTNQCGRTIDYCQERSGKKMCCSFVSEDLSTTDSCFEGDGMKRDGGQY